MCLTIYVFIFEGKSPAADKTLSFNKTWVVRKLARSVQYFYVVIVSALLLVLIVV